MANRPNVGIIQRKSAAPYNLQELASKLKSSVVLSLDDSSNSNLNFESSHSRNGSIDSIVDENKILIQTGPRRGSASDLETSGPVAKLVYNTTYGGQMSFDLNRQETSIGRKEDNHIALSCAKISKYHASIIRKDNRYYVKDNNSSNGIKVNEIEVEPNVLFLLTDGDELAIGTITLSFILSGNNFKENSAFTKVDSNLKLVTILPSEKKYEETVTIRAEFDPEVEIDFRKIEDLGDDISTLKEDYEKLRLAYELSKGSQNNDINQLLGKSMDLIFEILPLDRGVVLLVDQNTGILGTHFVKIRQGKSNEGREILLSSTILRKVFYSRKCLITSDACEDPMLGKAASVKHGQIRSVVCVPMIAHNKVLGILHLDSRDRIKAFSNKDLGLIKAISNQTSIAIENSILVKEVETKARITEQLSRFLAPHVVDRMTNRTDIIKRGGREITGTIIFSDIRGFTNLSERLDKTEVFNLLNDYFERLVKIVFKYNGVVDKFIGDALMAVFGTLEEEADSEFRAIAAALEFKNAIDDMNRERNSQEKESISIGVGLNTGELLVGFVGSNQRLEYTCIGDTVNTSSRICSLANNNRVLISESTYNAVKNRFNVLPFGMHQLKGKLKQVMIYEAISIIE